MSPCGWRLSRRSIRTRAAFAFAWTTDAAPLMPFEFGVSVQEPSEREVSVRLVLLSNAGLRLAGDRAVVELEATDPYGQDCPTEYSARLTFDARSGRLGN